MGDFVNDTKGKLGKVLNIANDSTKFGITLFRSEILNFFWLHWIKLWNFNETGCFSLTNNQNNQISLLTELFQQQNIFATEFESTCKIYTKTNTFLGQNI